MGAIWEKQFVASDLMDVRAKAMQEHARITETPMLDAVAGSSGDFGELANALGVETLESEVAAQASVPQ